jgi:hypothetical protein
MVRNRAATDAMIRKNPAGIHNSPIAAFIRSYPIVRVEASARMRAQRPPASAGWFPNIVQANRRAA